MLYNIIYCVQSFQVIVNNISELTTSANVTSITECNENISQPTRLSLNTSSISTLKENERKEYDKCKKLMKKQYLRIIIMRKKMKILQYRNRMLKNKLDSDAYRKAVSKIFNEDQLRALFKNKKGRIRNWSNETIQRALKYKFACGVSGYEELLRQGIPLPSLRTLSRKLEDFKFQPGISNDMLKFLKYKKSFFNKERDIECGLVFDEMSITSKKCYNPATGSLVGDITFPGEKGIATHALVFMLVGICNRWKHIVGYHFTGNSFNSNTLKQIIFQIINKTEKLGFHINFITSDMGSGNTGLWKLLDINTGRYSKIKNYIIHPCDDTRYLYVIADIPHI